MDLELIVVDDGSADETPRGLAEVADPRLRVLRNDVAQGVARARNRGVAAASAPWVAFLDDDDLWSPWKLRRQLDAVGAVEGAGFAYAAAVFLDGAGAPLRPDPAPPAETVARALRARDVVGGPSTVLARTELVRELGGFDDALSVLADWDLWLRLAELAPAVACPEVLVAYREHGDNMSAETAHGVFAELDVLRRRHALGSELDGVEFTRWVAGHQRRAGRPFAAARAYLHGARQFRSGVTARARAGRCRSARAPWAFPPSCGRCEENAPRFCHPTGWMPTRDWWRPIAHKPNRAYFCDRGSRWILANSTRGRGALPRLRANRLPLAHRSRSSSRRGIAGPRSRGRSPARCTSRASTSR